MKKYLTIVIAIFILTGCYTSTHGFVRYIDRNPNLTPSQADKAFGSPINIQHLTDKIQYRVYQVSQDWLSSSKDVAVYFIDNKFYRYGEDNGFFHLSVARDLNFINDEQYNEQYTNLSNELNERRKALIPLIGLMQENAYQNSMLENQREQMKLQKESIRQQQQKRCYANCSPSIIGGNGTTSGANCVTQCY